MIKQIKNIILIVSLTIICFLILKNSNEVVKNVKNGIDIWKNSIFPSIFPFFILSNIMIKYGFVELFKELFKPLMKLIKITSNAAFIFVMSIISGCPSNAKYVKTLYNQNLISKEEAERILTFTHFSNPLFILGPVASIYLNNYKLALLILIIHYLTNIIIAFIFSINKPKVNYSKIKYKEALKNINNSINKNNLIKIIIESIKDSLDTVFLILGTICFFMVITTIINSLMPNNLIIKTIVSSIFELTQGLYNISILNVSSKFKALLAISSISFGGISIHMQIISIISDTDLDYKPYIVARIMHSAISSFILYIILYII